MSVSSRSPRAGSIAAGCCPQRGRCGSPVIPLTTSGLDRGIVFSDCFLLCYQVIPLTTSGIHCGTSTTSFAEELCRYPAHHERAPLRLHHGPA